MQDPDDNQTQPFTFRPIHHRRAHSEVNFRLPEDLDPVPDQFDTQVECNFEEIRSEDDIFATFMDMENLGVSNSGSDLNHGVSGDNAGGSAAAEGGGDGDGEKLTADVAENSRPRHMHSNSVDSSSLDESSIEAKKAMAPDKLTELWAADPKRAKRIMANRQSAARSKERKLRYISDLERKVQTLQKEATTLAAQLTMFEKDTTGLTTVNKELKFQVQAMEQQGQLRDALNQALKQEVERLKIATGEILGQADAYNLEMQQLIPYDQSALFAIQPQSGLNESQNTMMSVPQYDMLHPNMSIHHSQTVLNESQNTMMPQYDMPHPNMSIHHSQTVLNESQNTMMPQYDMPHPNMSNHHSQSGLNESHNTMMPQYDMLHPNMSNHHSQSGLNESHNTRMPQYDIPHPNMSNHHSHLIAANHAQTFSDMLPHDPLGRFQGLDIGSHNSHLLRPEGPSVSVGESSNSF